MNPNEGRIADVVPLRLVASPRGGNGGGTPGRVQGPDRCRCRVPEVAAEGRQVWCSVCQGQLDPVLTVVWLDARLKQVQVKNQALRAEAAELREAKAMAEFRERLDGARGRWRSRAVGGPWHRRVASREPRYVDSACGQRQHIGAVEFGAEDGIGDDGPYPACEAWGGASSWVDAPG